MFIKKKIKSASIFLLMICCIFSSNAQRRRSGNPIIKVQLIAINDVYEITPLDNGKSGGLARVATIVKKLKQQNPNTYALLAGDFLNPSVIGTLTYNNQRIRGKQMIEVLNAAGFDLVTFGNHEFDIAYEDLQKRIDESTFDWITGNCFFKNKNGEIGPFYKSINGKKHFFKPYTFIPIKNNNSIIKNRIGVVSAVINSNPVDYVFYENADSSFKQQVNLLKDSAAFIIALTHLTQGHDAKLAMNNPSVKLFIGGHEHENMLFKVNTTIIAKADANVRSVYLHELWVDAKTFQLKDIHSQLLKITDSIPEDTATQLVVNKWQQIANESLKGIGIDSDKTVIELSQPLDALSATVRTRQCLVGSILTQAMLQAAPNATIAITNSGSIRLDDKLFGRVSQYDIVRLLPFGGKIFEVELKGKLLIKLLTISEANNKGLGGYLQYNGVHYESSTNKWFAANEEIENEKVYRVVLPDFLLRGLEVNLEFFNRNNTDVIKVYDDLPASSDMNDIRKVLIRYLEKIKL